MTACTRSTRQTAASDTPASSTQAPAPAGSSAAPNQSTANRKEPRKMFICTGYGTCTMAFSRSEHLARHIRKHTGERPFQCHCGRNFSRLDNLRQHAQSVHSHQPELNHSMMVRLSAVHSQLSSQAPNKKRRSIAGSSVSANSSPSNSTTVLPPSPTHTVDYASQQSPPSPAALQYSSAAGEPPHRYMDYIATPTPNPYTSQPAYTFSAEDADGYDLGSMSASVPRRLPNDSLYAQSSFASYYLGQQLYHNENTHQIHPRPASYHGSPSPPAVPSLFDTEGMASFTTSFMQHYSQLSVDGPFLSPGSDMTPGHLLYSRSSINGSSEDTDLPSLTVSNDGRSSSYPSPSTPSPTQTSFSAPPTASVGGLADMFTHDLLGPSVQDDDYITQHSASAIRYPSRSCSATPLTYSQGSISPSLVEPYSGPSSSTACNSKKRAFKKEAL